MIDLCNKIFRTKPICAAAKICHSGLWKTHAGIKRCLFTFVTMPEIIDAHRITGEDCFLVRILVEEVAQLEAAIDTLAKFGPVTISVILASYPSKAIVART